MKKETVPGKGKGGKAMRDKDLKRRLSALTVPQYSQKGLRDTIARAKEFPLHPEKQRMTTAQFFRDQVRFIRKEFWCLKVILSTLIFWMTISEGMGEDTWFWTFVSISGPALCLVNANMLCDACQPGMLELHMTARHSLQKVLVFRVLVSGAMDLLIYACGAAALVLWRGVYLWQVFLYAAVPYSLTCLGCLALLNRRDKEDTLLYCMAWGILIIFVTTLLKSAGYRIFEAENTAVWIALGAAAALGDVKEMRKLIQKTGGNVDEINLGTII